MIEIRELTKDFGSFRVLDRINLSVETGECFGLLGPNGAGKTTLLNLICGLLNPTSGTARLDDFDLTRGLGLAPQEFALFSGLTGRENLRFFARINGRGEPEASEVADSLLRLVGLEGDAGRRTGIYSQGMKQRLNVAAALVDDPELILLDEPTAGLDPVARLAVWDLIGRMKLDGRTVVMATHNLEEADRLCDRVAILNRGSVRAIGNPRELTASHQAATFEECFLSVLEAGT